MLRGPTLESFSKHTTFLGSGRSYPSSVLLDPLFAWPVQLEAAVFICGLSLSDYIQRNIFCLALQLVNFNDVSIVQKTLSLEPCIGRVT